VGIGTSSLNSLTSRSVCVISLSYVSTKFDDTVVSPLSLIQPRDVCVQARFLPTQSRHFSTSPTNTDTGRADPSLSFAGPTPYNGCETTPPARHPPAEQKKTSSTGGLLFAAMFLLLERFLAGTSHKPRHSRLVC
jgi:hypothetical protein